MRLVIAIFLLLLAPTADAVRRYTVVFALPNKVDFSQEDRINGMLMDRASVDVHRVVWSGHDEDQPDLVRRIRALKPQLIYTWGTPTTLAVAGTYDAKDRGRHIFDIPVVFLTVAYPEQVKLVFSEADPGRKVTGFIHIAPMHEQMRYLRQWGPVRRIGTLYAPIEANSRIAVSDLHRWCSNNGVELRAEAIYRPEENSEEQVKEAIARLVDARVEWLYIPPDSHIGLRLAKLVTSTATAAGLPTFSSVETPVRRASALWGLYASRDGAAQLIADTIVRILHGSVPAEHIPVVRLKQKLAINRETMKALQMYPPIELLRNTRLDP